MQIAFDKDVALEQYRKRVEENRGKQINNSTLPAGSSMYYYCEHCGAHTETLPELHTKAPRIICVPCAALRAHGLI